MYGLYAVYGDCYELEEIFDSFVEAILAEREREEWCDGYEEWYFVHRLDSPLQW